MKGPTPHIFPLPSPYYSASDKQIIYQSDYGFVKRSNDIITNYKIPQVPFKK